MLSGDEVQKEEKEQSEVPQSSHLLEVKIT
jgi:hypothetical protein